MNKISILFACAALATACAEQPSNDVQAPTPAPSSAQSEASATPEPAGYYEYLWCKNGENASDEAIASLVADWNAEIDKLDTQPNAAFAYIPRGWSDDNFDGLWVLNWPDKAAMSAGWAQYAAADAQTRIDARNPGVLTCGSESGVDRFPEISFTPREIPESFSTTESPYYLTNQLCSFNEGKSAEDVRSVIRDQFLPAVEAVATENPESTYWFRVGRPDYTPIANYEHDFNWVNIWQNAEEGEASSADFDASDAGKAVQASFDEVATCEPAIAQAWDGYFLRTGEGN